MAEKKPIPMGAGESAAPIRLSGNSLASMAAKGPAYIRTVAAMSGHSDASFIPRGQPQTQQQMGRPTRIATIFARGQKYFDTAKKTPVTIVRAKAALTKRTKTVCHEVVNSKGQTYLARENELVPLP